MKLFTDKIDWLILTCVIIPGALLITGMIYAGFVLHEKTIECDAKNGIMVKTSSLGYVCIDKGVLKNV